MNTCTLDCIELIGNYSREATCDYVQSACEQNTVQFVQAYYCVLNQSFILLICLSVQYLSTIDYMHDIRILRSQQSH